MTEAHEAHPPNVTPEFAALVTTLPSLPTSDLLGFLKNADHLLETVAPEYARTRNGALMAHAKALFRAAMLAVETEIDARIPPRAR